MGLLKMNVTFLYLCSVSLVWAAEEVALVEMDSFALAADSCSADSLRVATADPFSWVPVIIACLLSGVVLIVFRLRR